MYEITIKDSINNTEATFKVDGYVLGTITENEDENSKFTEADINLGDINKYEIAHIKLIVDEMTDEEKDNSVLLSTKLG